VLKKIWLGPHREYQVFACERDAVSVDHSVFAREASYPT
jgi:hypothetical protein